VIGLTLAYGMLEKTHPRVNANALRQPPLAIRPIT